MLRVERIGKISDGLRFVQEHFAAERNGTVAVGSIVHKTESKDLRKHIILAREPLFPLSKIAAKLFRRFFSFYSLMTELQSVRIDKWLWAARFFKTRTLAQEAVELGRVRLDGNRIKSSREVKPGDRLEITRGEEKFTVFVEKLSVVRGPASVAQTLYRETDESKILREENAAIRKLAAEPALSIKKGRPTKRDARRIRYFTREGFE